MQKLMIRKPKTYERINEASFTPGASAAILIALGLYIVYFLLRQIPANIIDLIYYSGHKALHQWEVDQIIHDYLTSPGDMLAALLLVALLPAITMLYVRKIEKRAFVTIGLARPAISRFVFGCAAGLAIFLLAVLPAFISGTAQYKGAAPAVLLFILGYAVLAVSEEIFFRGYALSSFTVKMGAIPAALISSAMFAGLYVWSFGASGLMIPALFLSGILYSLITLRTGSVWAAAGIHAVRSFAFGLVSPVIMDDLATDYSIMSLSGGGTGDLYHIISMAACAVIIILVLFAGKNRLAAPISDERCMYLKARAAVKDALEGVRGDNGMPYKDFAFSIAASVQSDGAKTAALLYAMRLGGAEFAEADYSTDVLEALKTLVSGKGVLNNQTALEIKYAAEKCRRALRKR